MAIRDRVTVKTVDGTVTSITVARQGGSIDVSEPTQRDPYLRATLFTKEGKEEGTRLVVPANQVLWMLRDQEPKPEGKASK